MHCFSQALNNFDQAMSGNKRKTAYKYVQILKSANAPWTAEEFTLPPLISILDLAYIFLYLWNSQTHFGCQVYLYYLFDADRLASRIKLGLFREEIEEHVLVQSHI